MKRISVKFAILLILMAAIGGIAWGIYLEHQVLGLLHETSCYAIY